MINEANASSSACRLWRVFQVETSTPPASDGNMEAGRGTVKLREADVPLFGRAALDSSGRTAAETVRPGSAPESGAEEIVGEQSG